MARLKYRQQEGEQTFASGESPLNRALDMTSKIGRDNLDMSQVSDYQKQRTSDTIQNMLDTIHEYKKKYPTPWTWDGK